MYRRVVIRDGDSVLRIDLDPAVSGNRKRTQPKIWKNQVHDKTEKIGLKMKDALNRVIECEELRMEWGDSGQLHGDNAGLKLNYYYK